MPSSIDELYMQRCLDLALLGQGYTSPNPMVGSVIVYKDRILGEGWHHAAGLPHAEIEALASVREADRPLLKESTLYVNLEPCSHYGKTPPCCETIGRIGVKRVVVGIEDPSKKVSGAGIRHLRSLGIEVSVGLLADECRELNRVFLTNHTLQRPYITLKWAQSADGWIAGKDPQKGTWQPVRLSDPLRQREVHRLRAYHDAILVGGNTARIDNPQLTNRLFWGKNPQRIILSSGIRKEDAPNSFDSVAPTRVVTLESLNKEALKRAVEKWYEEGISSLLVEGGRRVLQAFIDAQLFDSVEIEHSTILLHEGLAAPKLHR